MELEDESWLEEETLGNIDSREPQFNEHDRTSIQILWL